MTYKSVLKIVSTGLLGWLLATPAVQAEEGVVEEVIVTGSKIRQNPLEKTSPVNVLTSEDLDRNGIVSIADMLQRLPNSGGAINSRFNSSGNFGFPPDGGGIGAGAAQADLRHLGSKRVLVLVDGNRWVNGSSASGVSSAVDLNTIPKSIIDRVEILEDGASAIYGSDAIAGVINIITKQDYQGFEIEAYTGQFDEDDGESSSVEFSFGTNTDDTTMFFAASFTDQKEVFAKDRDISSFPVPGISECNSNCSSGTPQGRFFLTDPNTGTGLDLTVNDGVGGIPAYDPLDPGGPGDDFHPFATVDRFNFASFNLVQAPVKTWNVFSSLHHQLTDNVAFSAKALFNNRESRNQAAPEPLFIGPEAGNGNLLDTISVDVTNPFNPFGFTVDANTNGFFFGRRPLEGGPRIFRQNVDTFFVSGGFDGSFQISERTFYWDFTTAYSKNRATQIKTGGYNSRHLQQALGPLDECLALTGCVPFNFFGGQGADGLGSITQDQLDWVAFTQKDTSEQELRDYTFNISGNVADLPAGPLGIAAGFERREQRGFFQPDAIVVAGESAGVPSSPTAGEFEVDEFFLEVNVPILADLPGAEVLTVNGAVRSSDYDTSGSDSTTKFSVNWKPFNDILIRASVAEGFRAPGIGELFGSQARFDQTLADPCSGLTAGTPQNVFDNCVALGVPSDGSYVQFNQQISVTTGGNPGLDPETSDSVVWGIVYSPSWVDSVNWVDSFSAELNVYDIEIDDAIQALDAEVQLNGCVNNLDTVLCSGISRTSGGVINGFANQLTNIGGIDTNGYDISIRYASPVTDIGQFRVSWVNSIIDAYTEIIPTASGFTDVDLEGTEVGDPEKAYPEWKFTLTLDWAYQDWAAAWTVRYTDEVDEVCPGGTPQCSGTLDDTYFNDLQVSYHPSRWLNGINFTVGVNNILDEDPPECFSCALNGFDATAYDVPGQFVYARVSYRSEG